MQKNLQDNLFKHYIKKSRFKAKDQSYLKNDFDILSVQRNLKILGIFVRLYKRDKKPNYLKYLPTPGRFLKEEWEILFLINWIYYLKSIYL